MAPDITRIAAATMAVTKVALEALTIGFFAWLRPGLAGVRAEIHAIGRRFKDRRLAVDAHLSVRLKGLGHAARVRVELPDPKPPTEVRMDGGSDAPRLDGGMPEWTLLRPAPGRIIAVSSRA